MYSEQEKLKMSRIFLISAIAEQQPEDTISSISNDEQINTIFRHLFNYGYDVTLLDLSVLPQDSIGVKFSSVVNELQIMDRLCSADAVILLTNGYSTCTVELTRNISRVLSKKLKKTNITNENGITCTVLGACTKKTKVTKELWELFNQQHQKLDFSSIFPYDSLRPYRLDYSKESAQPTVS